MTLTPLWRNRLSVAAAVGLAVVLGVQIAQESSFWPMLLAGGLTAVVLARSQSLPLGTVLLGLLTIGYFVGNRGFAQLSVSGNFPLLPAELVLLVAGGILLVQCALRRELPLRRDALNYALLVWMLVGTARLESDVRLFGVAALRDYATVYYAAFFFLAQAAGRTEAGRRFLHRCLLIGGGFILLAFALFQRFPDFFLNTLTVRGVPLIFFKGDLAGTFMAVGAVAFFLWFEEHKAGWALALSLLLTVAVAATNNRASFVGLAVATAALGIGGRWRFAALQIGGGAVAAIVILLAAAATNQSWDQTVLHDVYERAVSVADPLGQRSYAGEDNYFKGDNNLFRTVWWRTVIGETVHESPWLGLGWGADLAEPFVRIYFPEGSEDFTARSPHNIMITLFARTGAIGLVPFFAVLGLMAVRTVRAVRRGTPQSAALWCGAWVIFASACFGVVLEGPMGAVVFWTLLGMANAANAETTPVGEPAADSTVVPLPRAAGGV